LARWQPYATNLEGDCQLWHGANHRIEHVGEQKWICAASSESANRASFARLIAQCRNARCSCKERHRWREGSAEFFDERIGHAQRFEWTQEDKATCGEGDESRASADRLFH
jgi:hypothetical protein